jgi:hypothetical protein
MLKLENQFITLLVMEQINIPLGLKLAEVKKIFVLEGETWDATIIKYDILYDRELFNFYVHGQNDER